MKISPTAIQDFVVCSKKLFFRYGGFEQQYDENLTVGKLVHHLIELNETENKELLKRLSSEYNIGTKSAEYKLNRCLHNFNTHFKILTQPDDIIEYKFEHKLKRVDATIIGRIDRIINLSYPLVVDWKTSRKEILNIDNDIQFMMYYYIYNEIFGVAPEVMAVNLYLAEVTKYDYNPESFELLFNHTIPKMIDTIRSKSYTETENIEICKTCPYRIHCRGKL